MTTNNEYDLRAIANTIKRLGNIPAERYASWYGLKPAEIKYLEQFVKEYSDNG